MGRTKKMTLSKGRTYKEDRLFAKPILDFIVERHNLKYVEVYRHIRAFDMEFDIVVRGRQRKRVNRIFCFELKINDFDTALYQATIRSDYCNYAYAVLKELEMSVKSYLYLKDAIKSGVGILQFIPEYRNNKKKPFMSLVKNALINWDLDIKEWNKVLSNKSPIYKNKFK